MFLDTYIHVHTEYSNLRIKDSTVKINELLQLCKKQGVKSCSITDHEALTGHVEFLNEIDKMKKEGYEIKPILGNEIYVTEEDSHTKNEGHFTGREYNHLILLAKNLNGYKQLCQLSSQAWENGFFSSRYFRVPVDYSDLKKYIKKGDMIISSACLGSFLGRRLLTMYYAKQEGNIEAVKEQAKLLDEWILKYKDLVAEGDLYFEIQPNEPNTDQWIANKLIVKFAEKYNIPVIVTCDIHYLRPENRESHEVFLRSKDDDNREVASFYKYTYFFTSDELEKFIRKNLGAEKYKEIIKNTNAVKDKIEIYSLDLPTQMPNINVPTKIEFKEVFKGYYDSHPAFKFFRYSDDVYNQLLFRNIENGFIERILNHPDKSKEKEKYIEELHTNLDVLQFMQTEHNKNFSSYFLVVKELNDLIIDKADSFMGLSRGSACSFLVNYLLGIVEVDPVKWGLPYWRFMNKSRVDDPDCDSDFSPFKKSAIMKTMYEYYGEDKVLPISTVGTEGSKSAIGSTGRGLNNIQKDIDGTEYIDLGTMQKIADLIPVDRGEAWAISDCIFGNEEKNRDPIRLLQNYYKTYPKLFDYAIQMEGLVNKRSRHASGVIIYPDDYNNYNSMMKTPSQERVTGLTMNDSEQRGGIKIDILYTEYQGVLQLCLELMRDDDIIQAKNAREMMKFIHPDNIDLDDKKVYKTIFHTGNTDNIFQFDTDIGKGICAKLKPSNIVELATANSLMRLKSDFDLSFIAKDFDGVEVTDEMKKAFENEQLSDKYLRYKNNIKEVYYDMEAFNVRPEIQTRIMKTLQKTYGVCVSQEDLMRTTMEFAGFDLGGANKSRKIVAKKKLNDVAKLLIEFRDGCLKQGLTIYEAFYCWLLLYGQLAYSFNDAHTYSYSIQGYQGAWLKTYYPIYWATACLSVDAQAIENDNEKSKTTDYAQIAKAIFRIKNTGAEVKPPLINASRFDFTPDNENNSILYGLKALDGVSDSIAQQIIQNRPYKDFNDFLNKNVTDISDEDGKLGSKAMLSLIFSNSFRDIEPKRSECIKKYINTCFNDVEKLTTRYLADIRKVKFLPLEFDNMEGINKKMTVIKKHQNPEDKKTWKIPREDSDIIQHIYDFYEECIIEDNGDCILLEKKTANLIFKKAKERLDIWLQENEGIIKEKLNTSRMAKQYKEWTKEKSPADIEFQSLGMYLSNNWLDTASEDYSVMNFNDLIYGEENIKSWGKYKGVEYPIFNISQIPVTVIEKNTKHKTITCLTKNKIITCRIKAEIFDFYSQNFTRGTKLIIWGYRTNDDTFTIKLYGSVKKAVGDTHTIIPIDT